MAGWITSVLASPILARCEASLTDSMNFCAAARAALDAEPQNRAGPLGQILLGQLVVRVRRQARDS